MPTASAPTENPQSLRQKVREGTPVIGTFVKTNSHQTIEVLGFSGLDYVVVDAEHAPFDRASTDPLMACAAASGLPALVRIPNPDPSIINGYLDMGAAGILAPHTRSAADARAVVEAVKYGLGKRGFSPSGRAGSYGQVNAADYRANADATSNIWCQIEDIEAMAVLDEIAAVDDVDCLFIGPADLGLSLGVSGNNDPRLAEAIKAIAAAGRRHRRTVGLFVGNTEQIPAMLELGITLFICGSDQSLLLAKARQLAKDLAQITRTAKTA